MNIVKKIVSMVLVIALVGASQMNAYTYKFQDQSPYKARFDVKVQSALCKNPNPFEVPHGAEGKFDSNCFIDVIRAVVYSHDTSPYLWIPKEYRSSYDKEIQLDPATGLRLLSVQEVAVAGEGKSSYTGGTWYLRGPFKGDKVLMYNGANKTWDAESQERAKQPPFLYVKKGEATYMHPQGHTTVNHSYTVRR